MLYNQNLEIRIVQTLVENVKKNKECAEELQEYIALLESKVNIAKQERQKGRFQLKIKVRVEFARTM